MVAGVPPAKQNPAAGTAASTGMLMDRGAPPPSGAGDRALAITNSSAGNKEIAKGAETNRQGARTQRASCVLPTATGGD
ncbi:MAG: hypothetical protein DME71_00930 [Verrucomicrobia bacterium]|nr:MAG: hypothetical protein DME71_00930 [Verrucomicrobiota bacterium]